MTETCLVAEDKCPFPDWSLARNTELFKGNDKPARVVEEIKTAKWISNRMIVKLRKLLELTPFSCSTLINFSAAAFITDCLEGIMFVSESCHYLVLCT